MQFHTDSCAPGSPPRDAHPGEDPGAGAPRDVAALHLGALGDLVVALPALRFFRRAAGPRARLTALVGGRAKADLLRRCAVAHEAFDLTRADFAPLFAAGPPPPDLAPLLARCDAALVLLRDADGLAEGLRRAGARRVIALPPRPVPEGDVHAVDFLLASLRRALHCPSSPRHEPAPSPEPPLLPPAPRSAPAPPPEPAPSPAPAPAPHPHPHPLPHPRLLLPTSLRAHARDRLLSLGVPPGRGLAIHPGSGGRAKRWPLARFLALARAAPSSLGRAPLFLLGPVEADADPGLAAAVAAAGFPSVLEPPLPLLAALAAEAGLFLGNDGGPAHLAAAAGAPTLALFGPSSAAVWAPRGPRAETLRAPRGDLGALLERTVLEALARLA